MRQIQFISASHYQTSDRFYALPKVLFENPIYEDMRLDAKVAYAMLKDRLDLSFKNNWIDEDGNIYLVYSNSNLMKILNCSKYTLLRIKKQLTEYGLIHEVQQSTSKSGNLANRIYLSLLQDDTVERMVDKSGDSKSDTRGVSDLAPNDTEYSETNNKDTELVISEEDEERLPRNSQSNKQDGLSRKVDKASRYDKDYIYDLVYSQLLEENYSDTMAAYIMMPFEERYRYALENMRFARSSEVIAEYVFNGLLAIYNGNARKCMENN